MRILVTGSKGMVGTALVNNLKNIRDGKNRTRPNIFVEEIYEYDIESDPEELEEYCQKADFVFNLAGVNRPQNPEDFMKGNFGFASQLLDTLKKYQNKATIMLSSSIQATLAGRFGDSEYGRSKKAGEDVFFQYGDENEVKVAVYRFPNLMGHSRPKYNSAVSTFCWAVANDEEFTVNDRSTELELLYIDDLIEGMFDLLEEKEQHCEFDGVNTTQEETLFRIYSGETNYTSDFSLLIKNGNIDKSVPVRLIDPEISKRRLGCQQKCAIGKCKYCFNAFTLASILAEKGEIE